MYPSSLFIGSLTLSPCEVRVGSPCTFHAVTWNLRNTSYTMWSAVPFGGVRLGGAHLLNYLGPISENSQSSLCVTEDCGNQSWASGSPTSMFLLHSGCKCDVQERWGTVRGWKTKVPPISAVVKTRVLWWLGAKAMQLHYHIGEAGCQWKYSETILLVFTWWLLPEMRMHTEIF